MSDPAVVDAMRSDWNERAKEDANYYVAFGRRSQSEDEFFASAADVVRAIDAELKRRPASEWLGKRALEIGCGPGRLMRFMAERFSEVHGIDISDEMVRRAIHNLQDFPNAHPRHAPDSDLREFQDGSFDFVYSYAVFQHIPSRDAVLHYLREADRVLAPGGLMVFQINGLPGVGHVATTWNGARFSEDEMFRFAEERNLLLRALTGSETQYMWVTLEKRVAASPPPHLAAPAITGVTNAHTGEAAIPATGRMAAVSVWIDNLPDEADLLTLTGRVEANPVRGTYVGGGSKRRQFNFRLPAGVRTGLVRVELEWNGAPLCSPAWARVIPAGPRVPKIKSITDGTNLTAVSRIETGYGKLVIDEVENPNAVHIALDGTSVLDGEHFRIDPLSDLYEFNFRVPTDCTPGIHSLEVTLGARRFAPLAVQVA